MKIVKISGGLGNQMFQYAYGRNLELAGQKVIFDTSFYSGNLGTKDTPRYFKLDNFNITDCQFSNQARPALEILHKIKRRLGFKIEEYYQNENYFKNATALIKREFTLKRPFSESSQIWNNKIKAASHSVLLHIRRGDYVTNPYANAFHGLCSVEYYKMAVNELVERLQTRDITIFVFSDDIAWARENINFPYKIEFADVPDVPDYEKMILMAQCQHDIIANSTFSWWPAWLNNNPDKIVFAPRQWFKNKAAAAANDIVPNSWIKI